PRRAAAEAFRRSLVRWVSGFESKYSRFDDASLVGQINANAGTRWVEVDDESERLFALCDWYHWLTGGVFDPSMLPIIRLWDYHSAPSEVPGRAVVDRARDLTGWTKVIREKGRVLLPETGMGLDLGGIGKEYAVDRAIEMAEAAGIQDILVNFGNDVRVCGRPPEGGAWRIGLEHHSEPGKCWCGVGLEDGAVASSGDYVRNAWIDGKSYGHILDPRTGRPADSGVRQVSVIAPTCTEAGILSTTALVMGLEDGVEFLRHSFQAEGSVLSERERHETAGFRSYVV
ncbi:MAG: FAD:protein FMN transferase, partial [Lentisphaerae bacterium]|nr:FAD:protein FMN transferase [Lentisphaerota bacterium]